MTDQLTLRFSSLSAPLSTSTAHWLGPCSSSTIRGRVPGRFAVSRRTPALGNGRKRRCRCGDKRSPCPQRRAQTNSPPAKPPAPVARTVLRHSLREHGDGRRDPGQVAWAAGESLCRLPECSLSCKVSTVRTWSERGPLSSQGSSLQLACPCSTLCLRSALPSARRVRCDELRPTCKSCQKRNMKCHYELDPPGTEAPLDAMHEASIPPQSTHSAKARCCHNDARYVNGEQPPPCRRCLIPGYTFSSLVPLQPKVLPRRGQPLSDAGASKDFSHGDFPKSQAPALVSSASRALAMRRQRRWPPRQGQYITPVEELCPPDWHYSEAVFFCKFCPFPCLCYHYTRRVQDVNSATSQYVSPRQNFET